MHFTWICLNFTKENSLIAIIILAILKKSSKDFKVSKVVNYLLFIDWNASWLWVRIYVVSEDKSFLCFLKCQQWHKAHLIIHVKKLLRKISQHPATFKCCYITKIFTICCKYLHFSSYLKELVFSLLSTTLKWIDFKLLNISDL